MTTIPKPEKITAEEYFKRTENMEERTELIDGEIVAMASPSRMHQRIAGRLFNRADQFISANGGKCEAMQAVDVQLDDGNIVVPDVLVMCDPSKADDKRYYGAPDWVVEILSTNRDNDLIRKQALYKASGVREYWIIDPSGRKVWVYDFEQHPNVVELYDWTDEIPVRIYGGKLKIRIEDLI